MTHPRLSRRDWLRLSAAGVMALLDVGLAGDAGRRRRCQPQTQARLHPPVDERRSQPDGHLRSEARPRQRRPLQGDQDLRPRPAHQRASAAHRPLRRSHGRRPLDEHQGGRTRPGHIPDAHRLSADRTDPVPDARLARVSGTRRRGRAAAQLRQHRAVPLLQPRRLRPWLPGPEVRAADRRRRRPVLPATGPAATSRRSRCRTSTCPAASIAPTPTRASIY